MRALLLLAAMIGLSSAGAAAPPVISEAQGAAVAEAQRRGQDIYDFDQAAWGSADALTAAMPDPAGKGVKGWIVEREPGGTVATYYGLLYNRHNRPYKIFVAHMQGRAVIASHLLAPTEDSAMNAAEQQMVRARNIASTPEMAARVGVQRCEGGNLNSVVLQPDGSDGNVSVYILSPQVTNNSYPFGGHYRVDVGRDGSVRSARAFSRSCLSMTPQAPGGGLPAAMVVTHLLDPQPTEIHVWLSLVAKVPVLVATLPSKEMWAVQGNRIRLIQQIP